MFNFLKKISIILHSGRVVLWFPILTNVIVLSFCLHRSIAEALVLAASLCCVASYGFLINDLWDMAVDRRNKAGRLENVSANVLRMARVGTGLFLLFGLVLSCMLGLRSFLAISIVAVALTAYTCWVRPKLFLANILAALLASTPVWLPNIIFNESPRIAQTFLIAIAVLILLGREIVFDVADRLGDNKMKRQTIPIVFGDQMAAQVAVTLQLTGCALLIGSGLYGIWNLPAYVQLIVITTSIGFVLLIVPVSLKFLSTRNDASIINLFTLHTRLAMLLLPILLFVFTSK